MSNTLKNKLDLLIKTFSLAARDMEKSESNCYFVHGNMLADTNIYTVAFLINVIKELENEISHLVKAKKSFGLSFFELRNANINRIPQFKNAHGERAHSSDNGSDWSPSQWLQAVVGELGEYANVRKKYERGDISIAEFNELARREIADVQIYLDILAMQLGFDLGAATVEKFNEVSVRVGSNVFLGGVEIQHDQDINFESAEIPTSGNITLTKEEKPKINCLHEFKTDHYVRWGDYQICSKCQNKIFVELKLLSEK